MLIASPFLGEHLIVRQGSQNGIRIPRRKCWSVRELAEMAARAGFVDVEHRPTAGDRGVLLARKPA